MSRKPCIPRPWQPMMLDHLVDHPRCALWADMGMGKTGVTLHALAGLKLAGVGGKALVIGPLRVARDVWSDEAQRWTGLDDLTVQPIVGSETERITALRNDKADVYTINYENLLWLVDRLHHDWPFSIIVPDEARRLKGHRSKQGGVRTQALARIAFHPRVRYFWELCGRPASNGLLDLWGQIWYLDHGFRLGSAFNAFHDRWFGYRRIKDAINPSKTYVQRFPFPHAQDEIQGLLKDICLTVDPKDWFDVQDPIVQRVPVTLTGDAWRHYREMERAFFTEIEGTRFEAFSAGAKSVKCLAFASGFQYVPHTDKWITTHDKKMEALESIVEEANGASVLVGYWFKSSLARMKKAFPKGVDLATKEGLAAFKSGQASIGFGHPQSMGHGIDGLQNVCNIAVFADQFWDMDCRDQFIARIGPVRQKQAGLDRPVFVYDIVAERTLDEAVLERMDSKRSVQECLLNAMKRNKL